MSYDEIVEILARELFVLFGDYYYADWPLEEEKRRVYYRDKAKVLIRELSELDVWVLARDNLRSHRSSS